ncbi:tRNA pseudouridine synthase B [Paenibacillus sp. CECT 9249]|uniref:tRNA pseudouridine(55) synthase TruB n=1 Tax=Paenibacillus sp. CECT 9249 TaxID=2845385 RepID=UPI001E42C2E8|nr:tRNA pseudouridine(55) synthase TruB [Paenibacillus sp. CECT 9249]CAH0119857.1 tRNA pseudouridine synthase B [Paenibacillus sp. CECT 9249]
MSETDFQSPNHRILQSFQADGILPVWKPAGWTSHDVVAKARRLLRMKRIGHTGTLDPMVTGVLPLCLGRATRLVEYLQELPKEYEAVMRLGIATDTEDMSGQTIERQERVDVTEEQVRAALALFVGTNEQVPPMYSAVKVDGKRLYELAREGREVERNPRKVTIHALELLRCELNGPEPEIHFRVVCSKGTYIRTLCVDIGKALGLPATMASLVRTMSAHIRSESCLTLEQIESAVEAGKLHELLIPMDRAVRHLPAHTVAAEKAEQALQGQKLSVRAVSPAVEAPGLIRLYSPDGQFFGIYEREEHKGYIRPVKVFLPHL